MKIYDYDIESDGLLEEVTQIWCISMMNVETNKLYLYHNYPEYSQKTIEIDGEVVKLPKRDGSIDEGVKELFTADIIRCHNQIGYDLPLLKKFYPDLKTGFEYPRFTDTLLESRVQHFDRPTIKGVKGNHSLAYYGMKLGNKKPVIESFKEMSGKIIHRLVEDVRIQNLTSEYLIRERKAIKERCAGIDFTKSMKEEQEYAYRESKQSSGGINVNKPFMESCVEDLTGRIEEISDRVSPQLPNYVEFKSVKVTLQEIAKALNRKKIPPIKYIMKEGPDGSLVRVSVKNWWKPTVNFTKKKLVVSYSAEDLEGDTCIQTFNKLSEIRKHIRDDLGLKLKRFKITKKEVDSKVLNSYTMNWFNLGEDCVDIIWGPHTRVVFHKVKLTQSDRVKKYLLDYCGWIPDEWNYKKDPKTGKFLKDDKYQLIKASPKLSESSYKTIKGGIGTDIALFNTYQHRRNYIKNLKDDTKGLLNKIRSDGRITAGMSTYGTTASRSSQYGVVNLPSPAAVFGEEMRSIFIADNDDCVLIGADMPNAHNTILADLTANKKYIDAVTNGIEEDDEGNFVGTDGHTVNGVLFGIIDEGELAEAVRTQDHKLISKIKKQRKTAKGCGFACLYGGSGKKLAAIIGGILEGEGEKRKQSFLNGLGLKPVLDNLLSTWDDKKWGSGSFVSILGDYHILADSKHKLINYLALGSEAVIVKKSINWMMREFEKSGLKTRLVLVIHDEFLLNVPKDEVEVVYEIASKAFDVGAKAVGLTLPFLSIPKVGKTYYECH